jgi:hypothetical protein
MIETQAILPIVPASQVPAVNAKDQGQGGGLRCHEWRRWHTRKFFLCYVYRLGLLR